MVPRPILWGMIDPIFRHHAKFSSSIWSVKIVGMKNLGAGGPAPVGVEVGLTP